MVASSRYQNYFPTLSAEIQQDIYGRMNELLAEEKEYCDKGNYAHMSQILTSIALYFMPAICAQDHRITKAMHGIPIRTHTVAAGDDYCDWWYFGDRQELPEEAARRLKGKK